MSASLCGGIGAGPVATGSAASGSSLVLTLSRDVPCDCLIYVVYGLGYFHAATSDVSNIASSGTDTFGHTYTCSTLSKCLIGAIRQNKVVSGADQSSILMGSAIASVNAGEMSNGDTITLTISTAHSSVLESVGMAFAITGIGETAVAQESFGSSMYTVDYADGDGYPTDPTSTTLNWMSNYGYNPNPQTEAALLCGALSWPDSGAYTPAAATLLGKTNSTNMGLALAMKTVAAAETTEPGGSWASAATAHVGNYQYAELVAPPTGPRISLRFRAA